ncbi:Mitochondrial import inner membrane translocase subunit tim23 [Tilletia horrida]|uniref:Mitochondrial import inner membrane translocase subunit tim23 n=1 Tax=Tilletia horrida TaxID=155126 RepID=A0AAN6GVS1_9BASI|nr:Mitochondrial import inner membrane translocase subunit tim23 [Tilletia horrida]KAK0557372.1 Mitochondrial import inner membrane translocase subunit tim23 [Tilletia horrida]
MWPFSSSSASTSAQPVPSSSTGPEQPQLEPVQPQQQPYPGSIPSSASATPLADPALYAPTAAQLLSSPTFNPNNINPLASLSQNEIEYLDLLDNVGPVQGNVVPNRGFGDGLTYGTGTVYLSGLAFGGLIGMREGLFRPIGVDNPTFRLRLNTVLNAVTRRGTSLGNNGGCLALMYNLAELGISSARGSVSDPFSSVGAAGLTGVIFRSTAGVRQALVSGAVFAGAGAAWQGVKQAIF